MKLFDSHAHLDQEGFPEGIDDVLQRAHSAGVQWITTIGSSHDTRVMRHAIDVAQAHDFIWAAIGVHPHEAKDATSDTFGELKALLGSQRVVALGECGLDFHYMSSPRDDQVAVFQAQVRLAFDTGLPLVLHCRDAHQDCLDVLRQGPLNDPPGIVHCFSGTKEQMQDYLEMGFYISIPGIVTFKNAAPLQEAVRVLPMDRMLIETDSPYLSPVPFRGKRNEPARVVYTAQAIAGIKGCSLQDVADVTVENTKRIYRIQE